MRRVQGCCLQWLPIRTAALGHERAEGAEMIDTDVLDALDGWRFTPQPGDQLTDAAVVELERPGRDKVAPTLQSEDLVRLIERRRTTAQDPSENPHGGCLHGRHSAVDLAARPPRKPPDSAFSAELPRRSPSDAA
jgi:hypothetical protein